MILKILFTFEALKLVIGINGSQHIRTDLNLLEVNVIIIHRIIFLSKRLIFCSSIGRKIFINNISFKIKRKLSDLEEKFVD